MNIDRIIIFIWIVTCSHYRWSHTKIAVKKRTTLLVSQDSSINLNRPIRNYCSKQKSLHLENGVGWNYSCKQPATTCCKGTDWQKVARFRVAAGCEMCRSSRRDLPQALRSCRWNIAEKRHKGSEGELPIGSVAVNKGLGRCQAVARCHLRCDSAGAATATG